MAGERRKPPYALRLLGAVALIGVGAVHIEEYFAVHYSVVPVIGPIFVLNTIGAVGIALFLILPSERILGAAIRLVAIAGIGLAATAGILLVVSEYTTLFGFRENGYRTAIILSLVAEGLTVGLLGAYLAALVKVGRVSAARTGQQEPGSSDAVAPQ